MQSIPKLTQNLRKFAEERDWQQFHTPKNLAMAISVESAELLEIFQWLTPEQSKLPDADQLEKIRLETITIINHQPPLNERS